MTDRPTAVGALVAYNRVLAVRTRPDWCRGGPEMRKRELRAEIDRLQGELDNGYPQAAVDRKKLAAYEDVCRDLMRGASSMPTHIHRRLTGLLSGEASDD